MNKNDWTFVSVKSLNDGNTVEIIKRRDVNKSIFYKLGMDQKGVYERVVINRGDKTVAIDRMDMNWKDDAPFMGQRDHFMPSRKQEGGLDFIRHHFWLHKLLKFEA